MPANFRKEAGVALFFVIFLISFWIEPFVRMSVGNTTIIAVPPLGIGRAFCSVGRVATFPRVATAKYRSAPWMLRTSNTCTNQADRPTADQPGQRRARSVASALTYMYLFSINNTCVSTGNMLSHRAQSALMTSQSGNINDFPPKNLRSALYNTI